MNCLEVCGNGQQTSQAKNKAHLLNSATHYKSSVSKIMLQVCQLQKVLNLFVVSSDKAKTW